MQAGKSAGSNPSSAGTKKQDNYKKENIYISIAGFFVRMAAILLVVILITRAASYCYDFGYRIFNEPPMNSGTGRVVTISVEEDMSAKELGKQMEAKGLTRDWKLLMLQYYCSEFRDLIQPGVYQLNTNMTAEEMFEYIASFYVEPSEEEEEVPESSSEFEVEELPQEEVTKEE